MIYAVTVQVDLQTIDEVLPVRLMGGQLLPGVTRAIPGGVIAFQSAAISTSPAEPSLYHFVLQFGAAQAAALMGNWLFSQLRGAAAALNIAGHTIPIDHHTIITSLEQVA